MHVRHVRNGGRRRALPIFDYGTNSTRQAVIALNGQNNIPVLMWDNYSRGKVHTLIIPDYADLWKHPAKTVMKLRRVMTEKLHGVQLEGPAHVGLFAYDNGAFIVETFKTTPEKWQLRVPQGKAIEALTRPTFTSFSKLAVYEDGSTVYELKLPASTFAAFRLVEA